LSYFHQLKFGGKQDDMVSIRRFSDLFNHINFI